MPCPALPCCCVSAAAVERPQARHQAPRAAATRPHRQAPPSSTQDAPARRARCCLPFLCSWPQSPLHAGRNGRRRCSCCARVGRGRPAPPPAVTLAPHSLAAAKRSVVVLGLDLLFCWDWFISLRLLAHLCVPGLWHVMCVELWPPLLSSPTRACSAPLVLLRLPHSVCSARACARVCVRARVLRAPTHSVACVAGAADQAWNRCCRRAAAAQATVGRRARCCCRWWCRWLARAVSECVGCLVPQCTGGGGVSLVTPHGCCERRVVASVCVRTPDWAVCFAQRCRSVAQCQAHRLPGTRQGAHRRPLRSTQPPHSTPSAGCTSPWPAPAAATLATAAAAATQHAASAASAAAGPAAAARLMAANGDSSPPSLRSQAGAGPRWQQRALARTAAVARRAAQAGTEFALPSQPHMARSLCPGTRTCRRHC
jgi:hypothetical protein